MSDIFILVLVHQYYQIFFKAINYDNFITWLGIDKINFNALLKTTLATAKVHLDQDRKHLHSTKLTLEIGMYHFLIKNKKVYKCIYSLTQISEKEISYIHSTGKFPHESSRGNEYLLLLHDFDSNEILVEPLTTKQAGEIAKA